ncbi:MAG TPA: sigma-70 family RNA polymerase sigma factor [Thermoanaerobaculia bacterium]|nr:sigma-70 family RNA polymerase sigma factor [Thermoanaerobaculia bacterium]
MSAITISLAGNEPKSRTRVDDSDDASRFDEAVLPHVPSGYNLARWLTKNDDDARDVVQEAALRAWRFFGGFRGENGRAWFLTIVRRTAVTWLSRAAPERHAEPFDEEIHPAAEEAPDPERLAIGAASAERVRGALERLPPALREVVVLREQEGLSYKEIASVAEIPIGTVMSRLSRARERLVRDLSEPEER